jgi:hypothetical protein
VNLCIFLLFDKSILLFFIKLLPIRISIVFNAVVSFSSSSSPSSNSSFAVALMYILSMECKIDTLKMRMKCYNGLANETKTVVLTYN